MERAFYYSCQHFSSAAVLPKTCYNLLHGFGTVMYSLDENGFGVVLDIWDMMDRFFHQSYGTHLFAFHPVI
jgi:hypothetical protein